MSSPPVDADPPADFGALLRAALPGLDADTDLNDPASVRKAVESMRILVGLLRRLQQTVFSELEGLGKHHPRIRPMAEALAEQGLLDIDRVLAEVLSNSNADHTRIVHYADLLFRWWSAILAGVQSTVLQVPHELDDALNPVQWSVEKKRWSSEESTYWDHFKFVIRSELPLRVGDRLKQVRGDKTLEAYAILGSSSPKGPGE